MIEPTRDHIGGETLPQREVHIRNGEPARVGQP